MNKPYFIKWMLAEGKIKDNDYLVTCTDWSHKDIIHNKDGIFMSGYIAANSTLPLQKVKLFLCSRDIYTGDMAMLEDGDGVIGQFKVEEITPIILEKAFKKIGEISPEAYEHIKEGMELSKDDIRIMKTADKYNSKIIVEALGKKWTHPEDSYIIPGEVLYVKVKGPDGKFY